MAVLTAVLPSRKAVFAAAIATISIAASIAAGPALAQDTFKIGSAVGLTGYAATNDRNWRDGMMLAADELNAKGGLLGKKIELIFEDNKSEPQEAVVVYKKMIANDKVNVFDSGCVSAGNFAAAPAVIAAEIPMVLCSILPRRPEEQKWAFSFLPPPKFEIEARYQYLKDKTQIRKIGILHDPTPYASIMRDLGNALAKDYGLEVVAVESYKPDDADMSVQAGRLGAAGAGAIVKIGQGGSTVTIAKNIKALGLDKMLLMSSLDDANVFRQAADAIGDRFLFVAPGVQIPESITDPAAKATATAFLSKWNAKYPDRDGVAGSRAWDSMMMIAEAVTASKAIGGSALRDAFEKLPPFQGSAAGYAFTADQHVGVIKNPFRIGVVKDGKLAEVK